MTNEHSDEDSLPFFSVHSTEMDFVTAIEAGVMIPIAFENWNALNDWAEDENELKLTPIGNRDEKKNVALVSGYVISPFGGAKLPYCQVWARATYGSYREAMKFQIKTTEGSLKTVHLYDCDHAVARERLTAKWGDAWVNMVLVESSINRSVGAMLEKDDLEFPDDDDRIPMNAECIIKTFVKRNDKLTRDKVKEYLMNARNRFVYFQGKMGELRGNDLVEAISSYVSVGNVQEFFDEFARQLDVEPIDWSNEQFMIVVERQQT